jgi:hypothetical protein
VRHVIPTVALALSLGLATELNAQAAPSAGTLSGAVDDLPSVAALRAGIGAGGTPVAPRPLRPRDTARDAPDRSATGTGSLGRRVAHSAIGAGLGFVAGAGIGALIGSRTYGDGMFPPAAAYAIIGGAIGLVSGAVVGAFVR